MSAADWSLAGELAEARGMTAQRLVDLQVGLGDLTLVEAQAAVREAAAAYHSGEPVQEGTDRQRRQLQAVHRLAEAQLAREGREPALRRLEPDARRAAEVQP